MNNIAIYFVGTAGSGKSTLCAAFNQWCRSQGFSTLPVNLDPGAVFLPYEPELDIRQWINLGEVMEQYQLGPNGAQIVGADLLSANLPKVSAVLDAVDVDYILLDTPGQLELFSFRKSSRVLVDSLAPGRSALVYIFDVFNTNDTQGLITQMMLSATVQFRFSLPAVNVLSKVDLMEQEEVTKVLTWATNPDLLYDDSVLEMEQDPNASIMLSIEVFKVLHDQGVFTRLAPVSAPNNTGMEEIYQMVQNIYMGGDDLEGNRDVDGEGEG